MLLSTRSHRQFPHKYVCWRCLAKSAATGAFSNGSRRLPTRPTSWKGRLRSPPQQRHFGIGRAAFAAVESQSNHTLPYPPPVPKSSSLKSDIRDRLRQWEAENASSFVKIPDINVGPKPGAVSNSHTRSQSEVRLETDDVDDGTLMPFSNHGEMSEIGNNRKFLLPGDLVELRLGSAQEELAIFIRDLNFQSQFYTMSGRWVHKVASNVKFFVPGFVDPGELDDILPYLPQVEVPTELEDMLHSFKSVLPRNIGKPLIKKMSDFWAKADAVYQKAASRLDNAHNIVAHPTKISFATLAEIAEKVLPKAIAKSKGGNYSMPSLYAVHRCLLREEIGFGAQRHGNFRVAGQFVIHSQTEVKDVRKVAELVREYRESKVNSSETLNSHPIHSFLVKARHLIDLSRGNRQFTPHGTLGPSLTKLPDESAFKAGQFGQKQEIFNEIDMLFIRYLESWAGLTSFQLHSSFNGIGSAILRNINRYDLVNLDATTAWTCLQEIGVMPPWQTRASFDLMLPQTGVRLGLCHSEPPGDAAGAFQADGLKSIRKDWGELPVYCVDDINANEIDDGFSIEATNTPDEYWVHVHVADPAAHLDPSGPASQWAELQASTIYLPESVFPMLNRDYVQRSLSLAAERPCLTFSARMNLNGEILETDVTPGMIHNVVYMTPSVVKAVTSGEALSKTTTVYTVGSDIPNVSASRLLLDKAQLSDNQKKELKILHRIGIARVKQVQIKGALTTWFPSPSVSVSLSNSSFGGLSRWRSHQFFDDPTIQIGIAQSFEDGTTASSSLDLVGCLMLVAGEISAHWCHARGIPIPYRITPRNPSKDDPLEFFRRVILPSVAESKSPPLDDIRAYLNLVGPAQPSTTPGPHIALGSDMSTRCTSPLRRFSDLLVHWQIEAALLEQARSGQSLIGNTREDFLPFSKARIDAMLPRLSTQEKIISSNTREAERTWMMHFLLRAWRFGQAKVPPTLEFVVRSVNPDTVIMGGTLPFFLTGANANIPDWMRKDEVKPGDKFEVEIEEINVYKRSMLVKPLRHLEA